MYNGEVCTQELQNVQNNSLNLSILTAIDLDLTGREKEVVWAVQGLNAANASQDCVEAVRPWLCVTLFTSGGCENNSESFMSDDWQDMMTHCPASTVHFILQSSVYLHNCVPENISGMRRKIYLLHLTITCLSKACSL